MRGRVLALLVLLTAMGASGEARAATRYAVPGGTAGDGMCLSVGAGCSLAAVLEDVIVTGDEVVVTPGIYDLGNQGVYMRSTATSVNVHGQDGQPRPTILSTYFTTFSTCNPSTSCAGDGKTIRHLRIENRGTGTALYFVAGTPADPLVVDDVIAVGGTANSNAAMWGAAMPPTVSAAVIRNSTAYAPSTGPNASAILSQINLTLHNVTAVASAPGQIAMVQTGNCEPGTCSADTTSTVTNSILAGALSDVRTTASVIGCGAGGNSPCFGNLAIDYSNYDAITNCTGCSTSTPGSAHNQTAAPLLVDAAGGDFHQLLGSPTIDAGADDPANGTTDPDGNPRTLGAATDIGAYEDGHPRVVTATATNVSETGATLMGSVDPVGFATTYYFDWGPTDAYGSRVPAADASAGSATTPQPVSADLGGLAPGTTVHYRLVGSNAFGTVAGGDQSFTTLVTAPAPPALSITGVSVTNRRFRVGGRATPVIARKRAPVGTAFRYTLSEAATVTITLRRARPGRRVGKTCRAPARSNRTHRRCTRYVGAGKLTRRNQGPGAVTTAFSGRIARRKLSPGRYRAIIRGTDARGRSASAAPIGFSVVR